MTLGYSQAINPTDCTTFMASNIRISRGCFSSPPLVISPSTQTLDQMVAAAKSRNVMFVEAEANWQKSQMAKDYEKKCQELKDEELKEALVKHKQASLLEAKIATALFINYLNKGG